MKVPFVDLVSQYEEIKDEVHPALEKVMASAGFVLGAAVTSFEKNFAEYCESPHCVGVASGADALLLALKALHIGPGDEVITAANTFVATVNAIALAGATPVLVDVREEDYNLDPAHLANALTDKTRAIIPVHLYGQVADMDPILEFARAHGLHVVEDAAQAHGATYKGKKAGSMGDVGCFSFYPGKNLGSYGEGGAIVTPHADVAEQVRMYRNCGQSEKYVHPVIGYNSRLQSMQAAVLDVKLRHLEDWNTRRREVAALYTELLADTTLQLPATNPGNSHVWHLYVVQHSNRDALMDALKAEEVFCGIHYPIPIHAQEAYQGVRTIPNELPVTTRTAPRIVSLPIHPNLSDEQVRFVADAIHRFEASH